MSLLPIFFISCFFSLSRATDCGGNKVTQTLIVGKYGHNAFRTIQAAIDSVRSNNDQWVKIHIKAGLYEESVIIPVDKPCIILEGEGSGTIIRHSDHQSGDTDFIYGYGRSYYMNCFINVVGRFPNLPGFVTAQGRNSADDPSGFVFEGGSIVGNVKVNLGRAWRPYSRVIFKNTYFSDIVTPHGWVAWSASGNERTTTYAEIDCKGPGAADTSKRVPWMKKLSSSDLNEFSFASFINSDGWSMNLDDDIECRISIA
ncbi:hypothetical protein V8G54_035197 [Vigna mungo]|uniref:pectinesterase n=1 Tax=Vigna mungo TaxID=3915 RepID=A0AAQ3RE50_VIGMU